MAMAYLSSNEKFIFKNDRSDISEKLLAFYERNEFLDTVIVAENERFVAQAHKIILSASSEYFLELFRAYTTSSNVHKISLKNTDSSTLKTVIDFIYSGWIELSLEMVESILRTAVFLKMQSLIDGCIGFMQKHLSIGKCLDWLRLAKELNLSVLKKKALNFVYSNFGKLSREQDILLLDEIQLKDLLFNDNPREDLEEHVFLALEHWIQYDKSNRGHLTLQLLSMIRFKFLTPKFILGNRKSVCKTLESYELTDGWLEWHLSQENRSIDLTNCVLKTRKPNGKLTAINHLSLQGIINTQTYDEEMKVWTTAKQIPLLKNKERFSMIVIEEKLIVVGGRLNHMETNSVECLDLNTFEWTSLPPMREKRCYSKTAYSCGNLYVCSFSRSILELYSFITREWQNLQPPLELSDSSQIAAFNGILYIADLKKCCLQYFDVSSNQWTLKTVDEEQERYNFGFAAVNGFLYIIGGFQNMELLNTVKRYNLANDTWTEMAPLPLSCHSIITQVLGEKIVICGNYKNECVVQEYDLNTNTWSTMTANLNFHPMLLCIH